MTRTLVFWLLASLWIGITYAEDTPANNLFDKGNAAFQDKQYQDATNYYDSVLALGYQSPTLYYNLGNAYYKLGNFPKSILYYERARLLAGQWEPLEHNLSLAREHIADSVNREDRALIPRVWRKTLNYWSLETLANTSIGLAWLTGLGILIRLWIPYSWLKRTGVWLALISLVGFMLCLGMTAKRYHLINSQSEAIIISPSVAVKSAPDKTSKDLFVLQGGLKVSLTNQLDNWHQVRLPDGDTGWVKAKSLAII